LRAISGLTRRVREAHRLGATAVIVPTQGELDEVPGVSVHRCRSLAEALAVGQNGAK
jgi:predicted ATP-dependent serine protease